ncbi:PREDICTED: uncharacterized protein LOC108759824 [Trachymyrmex cornetzi]|uniref:uncharacterized protein LOC108759824 n=1 Tax=Trachymyrmex cornetzi TaxID=471704 RepID=UPI00084F1EA4|nr:PREDICTED: uncharacterized protein LOC108759824 [Trachymyrmex cornetzi]
MYCENETDCNKENNIGCNKEQLDEDLIAAVKSRPALYDFRLPLKERGRKHKDASWKEISEYLKEKLEICSRSNKMLYKEVVQRKPKLSSHLFVITM